MRWNEKMQFQFYNSEIKASFGFYRLVNIYINYALIPCPALSPTPSRFQRLHIRT